MAYATARRLLHRRAIFPPLLSRRNLSVSATADSQLDSNHNSSSSSAPDHSMESSNGDDAIFVKTRDKTSVTMPTSFMTGSIVGKRFYEQVTTRMADDGNGWTVMLDYRTLKTPSKRPMKLPTLSLAKAIAVEWEYQSLPQLKWCHTEIILRHKNMRTQYQQKDGIRPFTMPLMKLACTALERVPVTRAKIIDNLMRNFHQDLVFCRFPGDNDLTKGVLEKQEEKIDPILQWVESEFGFKPITYSSFFVGKQEEGFTKEIEILLKKTNDCQLASIDAMAAAAHSLIIPLAIFRGRLGIEEAIELIRLEEDHQVDRWGLVEGGHDVDVADLKVQISAAVVFLGLSQRL